MLSAGVVTVTASSLAAGSYSLTATYYGDTNYLQTNSNPLSFTVVTLPTPTLTLASSSVNSQYGSPVTLTATATGSSGVPSGSVTFTDGSITLGTSALNASGVASLTTSAIPGGASSIAASYPGSSAYDAATSNPVNILVTPVAPTITFTASPGIVKAGSPVTLTATVTGVGAIPTGFVQFGGTSTSVGLNANGVASLTTSWPTPGTEILTAVYVGDANYTAVTSSPIKVIVYGLTTPAITLTSSATSVNYGSPVSLKASLVGQQRTPTGTLTFVDGSATLDSQMLDATGSAAFSTSSLSVGSHSITAVYFGDSLNAPVVSTPVVVTVTTTVTLTTPATTFYVGSSDSISIAVAAVPGKPAPTGSITLTGGGFTSSATTLTAGSASITIPANALSVGTDTLTATYSGDAIYPASTGSLQVQVTSTPPGFALSGTALTVTAGASTGNTTTITVTPQEGFTGSVALTAAIASSPTGAVDLPTLSFGSTSPITLSGTSAGTATLTVTTTAPSTTARAPWYAIGGATLACLFFFGIPARKRSLRAMLALVFLIALCAGGCGGSSSGGGKQTNPGTTAGAYQIQVTATSGSVTSKTSIALNVQ